MKIHPTALVDPRAEIAEGVEIGPYAIVEGAVHLGERCTVGSHVVLQAPLEIGAGTRIFPHAVIGMAPQDLKYGGEPTGVVVGRENTIREFVTIHRGTVQGRSVTAIGAGNLLMAYSHIAHDAVIGDNCVLSNGVTLAGHVEIGDRAIVGGLSGIHQFVRIGRQAFVGGCSAIERDVVPFGLAAGNRATLRHYNGVGLTRSGSSAESLLRIRKIFQVLLDLSVNTAQAVARLEEEIDGPEAQEVATFIRESRRGILRGRRARGRAR